MNDMLAKNQIFNSLDTLPDNLANNQATSLLIFTGKVRKGLNDALSGKIYPKEEARKMLNKWLK